MVDVGCFAIDTDDDFESLPLLRASLLGMHLANVVLALRVVERTRQRRQNIRPVDAKCGSHFGSSIALTRSRRSRCVLVKAWVGLLLLQLVVWSKSAGRVSDGFKSRKKKLGGLSVVGCDSKISFGSHCQSRSSLGGWDSARKKAQLLPSDYYPPEAGIDNADKIGKDV